MRHAMITIPLAFVGPIVWEVSWLSYPFVIQLLKRRLAGKGIMKEDPWVAEQAVGGGFT